MRQLAKDIIVEIIRQAGGTFEGKTRLYKAFYFAHLYYFEDSDGRILSEWPIVRMPQGPGINDGHVLLEELERDGVIALATQLNGPYPESVYLLKNCSGDSPFDCMAESAIRRACEFVFYKRAHELSSFTHEFSRSWRETKNGDELNIYQDILDDDEHEAIKQKLSEAENVIRASLQT